MHEGKWNGLGGKFEAGETPEECAIREVEEESDWPTLKGDEIEAAKKEALEAKRKADAEKEARERADKPTDEAAASNLSKELVEFLDRIAQDRLEQGLGVRGRRRIVLVDQQGVKGPLPLVLQ